ncbi:hypothetical protein BS47DRAFT_1360885 [Hydnum rufescens UP504]|uniref:Cyanovirin-N domain-containing protein n=1 Tax=Hydnum rufescens UP504 TaxID=1448309 RepID=A0A9P6B255_9AGAM|nr:hypothetical protein BS47DRAFT_1360885 [Hydnum rufescens UP504]
MKLAHSLALFITAALILPSALANFHITRRDSIKGISLIACPSNYFNCKCLVNDDRAAHIAGNSLPSDSFSTEGNLCGMMHLNFYNRNDGHWSFTRTTEMGLCKESVTRMTEPRRVRTCSPHGQLGRSADCLGFVKCSVKIV